MAKEPDNQCDAPCERCAAYVQRMELRHATAMGAVQQQMELMRTVFDIKASSAQRRTEYQQGSIRKLLGEVQGLQACVSDPAGASRNRALVSKTIELSLDESSAQQLAKLTQLHADLTVERNKLLAELNRLRSAHAKELHELHSTHASEVQDLRGKLMRLNDMIHHMNTPKVVNVLRAFRAALTELRESLALIREEVRRSKLLAVTLNPCEAIALATAHLREAAAKLEEERNAALRFVNCLRQSFSDVWCGHPRLDFLRRDLGQGSDTAPLVDAVRRLSQLYTTAVDYQFARTDCSVQTHGSDSWRTMATQLPEHPGAPSAESIVEVTREEGLISVPEHPDLPPEQPLSCSADVAPFESRNASSCIHSSAGSSAETGAFSVASERATITATTNTAVEVERTPAPRIMAVNAASSPSLFDTGEEEKEDALSASVRLFAEFKKKRHSLARWLTRFRQRQVSRLTHLVESTPQIHTAVKRHVKPPVPPATPRPAPKPVTTGTWITFERCTTPKLKVPRKVPVPDPTSVLKLELGGGWRYGHLRTVVASHVPLDRTCGLGTTSPYAALYESVLHHSEALKHMTPRDAPIVHMLTAAEPLAKLGRNP